VTDRESNRPGHIVNRLTRILDVMSCFSRYVSRGARARAGSRRRLSPLAGGLLAAIVGFAASGHARPERADVLWSWHATATLQDGPCANLPTAYHVIGASRSSRRAPTRAGVPVATAAAPALLRARSSVLLLPDGPHRSTALVSRGYDATAPPRLLI
jgi:hypothetical protein